MPSRSRPTPRRRAVNATGASKSCCPARALSHASDAPTPHLALVAEPCRHGDPRTAGLVLRAARRSPGRLAAPAGHRAGPAVGLGERRTCCSTSFVARRERRLEAGVAERATRECRDNDPDEEAAALRERMSIALALLKKTRGTLGYLYEQPWYAIIGPPGAGKTTALLNSGLKFPLADNWDTVRWRASAAPGSATGGSPRMLC